MSKPRWSIDQNTAWQTSGLTRQQYCELYDIPFKSLQRWPQDIAKAERMANEPTALPVHIALPPVMNEPVTLFLIGGIRICCQPSQLTDVFRALKYAQA
ncbi:IS66 family insertion sequence element accessory protein TnpB [Salmonella enterica]|nr:IS66 family insertion sequence element accessory protein TnpB [Salmonella enterica subsp. enterica serovar Anecho]EIW6807033.1 IS66 family insertion sequence element accessory protein TnpB [Salmonella enterica]